MKINPELKPGDNIVLLHMAEEGKPPGLKGVVKRIVNFFNNKIIEVAWEDGSNLSLLSDVDAWTLDKSKKLNEEKNKWWIENLDVFKFKTQKFFRYLVKVRDSGIINMFGAAPLLWMGKERIEHEYKYENIPNEEAYQEVLDMADEIQGEMINQCIEILEDEKKELSVENINRCLQKYSQKLLIHYINLLS